MKNRDDDKFAMRNMINNLKSMADELEELLSEMDNLSEDEFDERAERIVDTYSRYGIELF